MSKRSSRNGHADRSFTVAAPKRFLSRARERAVLPHWSACFLKFPKLLGAGMIVASLVAGQAPSDPARHAEAGQRAQRSGDFPSAIREYTALARLLPDVAEVHSNLGVAHFFHKQRNEAIAAFENALRLKPDLVSALIFSGIAHHDLSQSKRAIGLLERASKLSPGDPLARLWLGFSYSAKSRFEEAAKQFLAASELQPANADAWYGLGSAYLELGRQQTRRLAELAPDGGRLWQLAGDLWHLRGEEAKARLFYQEADRRKSGPEEDACYKAATDFRQQAQAAFEKIATVAPNSHRARQLAAESLIAQRRTSDAVAEYRAVLERKPDLAGIHIEIGDLLMSEGKAADALVEYRLELRNRPNDARLHYRIGRAMAVLGDGKGAEEALRKSLALGPAPPGVLKELARLYNRQGLHGKAIESLSKYIQSAQNDASAHYLLMQAYSSVGDRQAAQRHHAKFNELSDNEKKRASLQEALSLFQPKKDALE